MFERIKTNIIVRHVLGFLGAAPGALKQHLNVNEVVRVVVATVVSGGGAYEAFAALAADIPSWVQPGDVGLATAVFVLVFEAARRLGQGKTPPPSLPPRAGALEITKSA